MSTVPTNGAHSRSGPYRSIVWGQDFEHGLYRLLRSSPCPCSLSGPRAALCDGPGAGFVFPFDGSPLLANTDLQGCMTAVSRSEGP